MTRTEILSCYSFYRNADPVIRSELENASVAVKLPPGTDYFREDGRCRQVALMSWCPLYTIYGITTCPLKKS